jgi:hypothetical protein
MTRGGWGIIGLLAGLLVVCPPSNGAETYRWVDKNGVIHFTDDPEELPEPQRTRVLRELERQEQERQEKERLETLHRSAPPPAPAPETEPGTPEQPSVPDERLPAEPAAEEPPAPPAPSVFPGTQRLEARKQSELRWREKAKQARDTVATLEAQCKKLEAQRDQARNASLTLGRPGDNQAHQKAYQEHAQCRAKLKTARTYLNDDLPEEARRAGVPPGWLEGN